MSDKYKTYEELKKEFGNNYDLIMYKINLYLLQRIDKAIEYNKENKKFANEVENGYAEEICKNNLKILGDKENRGE